MPSVESLASDTRFITFAVSDGDASRWPQNTRPPPPSAREVNWHRRMTLEEKYACRWKHLIGQGIAKLLNKPEIEKYCVQSFPEGYWMFDHNKGPIPNIRHDIYLYGSKTALRFRSPAEFIPHGYWLLTDPTLDRKNCGCKYCGGSGVKTQKEISEALGLPTNRETRAGTGDLTGTTRPSLRVSGRNSNWSSAATSVGPWVPRESRVPRKIEVEWGSKTLGLDLVASSTRTADFRSNRLFRLGELVWCLWNTEDFHTTREETDQGLRFWPAIVIGYGLDISVDHSLPSGLSCSESVIQTRRYCLRRLGTRSLDQNIGYECTLTEDKILPWHAHKMDWSSASLMSSSIQPQPRSNMSPFILGVRTAQILIRYWAVCDRLPINVLLSAGGEHGHVENIMEPPFTSSRPASPSSVPYSVDAILPQRSPARLVPMSVAKVNRPRHFNEATLTHMSASPNSTAKNPGASQALYELRSRSTVTAATEARYQGLWYGAERIWTGDLVRLSPERQAFSESLKSSPRASGNDARKQRVTPSPGAEMRGVLMRIDKIFTRVGEGRNKECAVAGPLYEIAPEDWKDLTEELSSVIPTSLQTSLPRKSAVVCEPTFPWNMAENLAPDAGGQESKRERLFDIPTTLAPAAPSGYVLRPLLPLGFEITVPLAYIAGRYYPEIFKSPLLSPLLQNIPKSVRSLSDFTSMGWRDIGLLSLCALAPGRYNCATCANVKVASRTGMLRDAVQLVNSEDECQT